MKVAIIGCGNIAQIHGWSLAYLDDVQMIAFVDCDIEKARRMSEKFTNGSADVYENYITMFERSKPDVVHICTPHYLHVPMAIEAVKRGVSVFMEKPPAITREEFDLLMACANEKNGKVGFCFQNRYNETTRMLDALVDGKELGKVIGVRGFVTWRREADYYGDDWHGNLSKEGGGVLINQSIHTLDLMLRYLGKPVKVEASMQNHHLKNVIEVEDTLEAWMEFEGGKRASLYATTAYATDAPVLLDITFENGHATMLDQSIYIKPKDGEARMEICEQKKDGVGKSYWGNGHLACIKNFYDSIRKGTHYQNDLAGVANTLYTTMEIYENARQREKREER